MRITPSSTIPPAMPKVPEMKEDSRMVAPMTARLVRDIPELLQNHAERASAPSIMSMVLLTP